MPVESAYGMGSLWSREVRIEHRKCMKNLHLELKRGWATQDTARCGMISDQDFFSSLC
jgi:hypothetical protein